MLHRYISVQFTLSIETDWKRKVEIFFDFIMPSIFVILRWYWYLNDAFFDVSCFSCMIIILCYSFGTVSSKHSLKVLVVSLSKVTNTYFPIKLILWLVFTSLPKSGLAVVQNLLLSVISNIWKCSFLTFFDVIHREKLCIYSIQYKNGCLAVSDIFHQFTQSLRITRIGYRYLKNEIHQIVKMNGCYFQQRKI